MASRSSVVVLATLFGVSHGCAHEKLLTRKPLSPARRLNSVQLHEASEWSDHIGHLDLGQVSGVDVNSKNQAYIFHRGERAWGVPSTRKWEKGFKDLFDDDDVFLPRQTIEAPCLVTVDAESGKKIGHFGSDKFLLPHGVTIDHEDNVWLTDVGSHLVHKFSKDHKELLTLGRNRTPGDAHDQFCKPTDVAVSKKDGMVFISDGYCNSRVVAYTASGKYHAHYDLPPKVGGDKVLPHSLTVDSTNNDLYVADRENGRLLHVKLSRDSRHHRTQVLHQLSGSEKLFALHFNNLHKSTGVISLLVQDNHGSKLQAFSLTAGKHAGSRRGGRKLLAKLETEMYLHSVSEDAEDEEETRRSKLTSLPAANVYEQSFLHDLAVKFTPVNQNGVVYAEFLTGGWKWDASASHHQKEGEVPTFIKPRVHRYAHKFDIKNAGSDGRMMISDVSK